MDEGLYNRPVSQHESSNGPRENEKRLVILLGWGKGAKAVIATILAVVRLFFDFSCNFCVPQVLRLTYICSEKNPLTFVQVVVVGTLSTQVSN